MEQECLSSRELSSAQSLLLEDSGGPWCWVTQLREKWGVAAEEREGEGEREREGEGSASLEVLWASSPCSSYGNQSGSPQHHHHDQGIGCEPSEPSSYPSSTDTDVTARVGPLYVGWEWVGWGGAL